MTPTMPRSGRDGRSIILLLLLRSLYYSQTLENNAINVFFWSLYYTTRFDASRRGKKMLKSSRDKNEGTHGSGEGGGEP